MQMRRTWYIYPYFFAADLHIKAASEGDRRSPATRWRRRLVCINLAQHSTNAPISAPAPARPNSYSVTNRGKTIDVRAVAASQGDGSQPKSGANDIISEKSDIDAASALRVHLATIRRKFPYKNICIDQCAFVFIDIYYFADAMNATADTYAARQRLPASS